MIFLLYLIGSWLFVHGIYQLIKYFIVTTDISKTFSTSFDSTNVDFSSVHKIIILVPVLHEEKNIEELLIDLAQQNYPADRYDVYVITTQKEYLNNAAPNTIDLLNQIVIEQRFPNLNLHLLHYPYINGFKADQLDFAFQQIRKDIDESEILNSFFISFDSDSKISSDTLSKLNNSIESGIEIYQLPLIWFKNIGALESWMMQSFSFLQSFFSISYEIPMFTGRFFPWRLKYLVGHGLCLSGAFLLRINVLPSIIEDVRLGRVSSYLNVKVKLIPEFGVVETAKNFPVYIKQSSVWFFGCGLFMSDYWLSMSFCKTTNVSFKVVFLMIYGLFKAFRWLNKGLFHFLGIILAIFYASIPLLVLFIFSLLINSVIEVFFVSRDYRHIWGRELDTHQQTKIVSHALLVSPIFYMFNFIGPYYGLYKLFKFYICQKIDLPKTER